jgi:hypothetical protein
MRTNKLDVGVLGASPVFFGAANAAKKILAAVVVMTAVAALNASASFYLNIVVDQHGDGFLGLYNESTMMPMGVVPLSYSTTTTDPYALSNPPDQAGTPSSYTLPSTLTITTGDIRIDNPQGTRQALLRFEPADPTTLFFYSAATGFPIMMQSNVKYFPSEVSMSGLMPSGLAITPPGTLGDEYTPSSGQVGYITGTYDGMTIAGVNYYILSDGTVSMAPEPGVYGALSGFAALLLGFKCSRNDKKRLLA